MAKFLKMVIIPNAGEPVEKLDHPFITDGDAKWYAYSGKDHGSYLQNQTCAYHMT